MIRRALVWVAAVAALAVWPGAAAAHHATLPSEAEAVLDALPGVQTPEPAGSEADLHSPNMELLANFDPDFTYRPPGAEEDQTDDPSGSDLAFWGNTAVLGTYDRPGGFRLVDIANPSKPELIADVYCPGTQADVSIFRDLVFVSVDSARKSPECGAGAAPTSQFMAGEAYEGIRIFDVSDRANPRQIHFVNTDCGSHTHTLVPDLGNGRILIYVLSYPLGVQAENCSVASHRKISIVEVPLEAPEKADVLTTYKVGDSTIGCHDVTVHMERELAAAACITESQIWDISEPTEPRKLSTIRHPDFQIHHSSAFSNDGQKVVLGDEMGGAAAALGCVDPHLPWAALWFFDLSDPAKPVAKGRLKLPEKEQREVSLLCTAHNFNTVPMRTDRDVLVSSFYNGGTTVVDYSETQKPTQIGFYKPVEDRSKDYEKASQWSSYWYNGHIYGNNFDVSYVPSDPRSRGFDVMALLDREIQSQAVRLPYLNPQTQEPLPPAKAEGPRSAPEPPAPVTAAGRVDTLRYAYHLDRRRLTRALRDGIRTRVRCSESCRPTAALTVSERDARRYGLSDTVVARGGRTKGVTGRKAFRLRFGREARRELSGARRLSLQLLAITYTADGERKVTRKRYSLRR